MTAYSLPVPRHAERADEQGWLAAARLGEQWALERFYHSYQSQVYALCLRLLQRPADAEDAMQETFVRAFRELPRFRGDSCAKTWVYRIAVNQALSMLRRRREGAELHEEAAVAADGAPGLVDQMEIRAALERTRPEHRAVLVLRFWEELSYEEIAAVLGISLPAVKMRLLRAREEFRKCYPTGR